uniref:Uncharacterized protein n=1 Tax=Ditylenchus dipsaci TaxID=166011 RepID=A0A915CRM9_9BILA
MARQPARLRRNRMYGNLEYILIEQLADVVFITADYLESVYNNLPDLTVTLQEDLRELHLDLFDIVENNPNFCGINQHTSTPTSNFSLSNSIGFSQKAAIEAPPGSSAVSVEEVSEEQDGDSSAPGHWVTEEIGDVNGQDISQGTDSNLNLNDESATPKISQVDSETEGSIVSEPISLPKKPEEMVRAPAVVAARPTAASISSNSSSSVQHTPPPGFETPSRKSSCSLDRPPGFETTTSSSPPGFTSAAKPTSVMPPSVFSPQKRVEVNVGKSVIQTPEERGPDQLLSFISNVNNKREENNQNVSKKPIQKPEENSKPQNNGHFYESDFEEDFGDLPAPKPHKVPEGISISSRKPAEHSNHQQPVMYKNLTSQSSHAENWDANDDVLPWDKMENIEQTVANLSRLHQLYPQGCTSLQLYKFDEALRLSSVESEECSSGQNFLSMAYLIENEMLQVCQGHLPELKELVPSGCKLGAQDLLRLCNRYPLLFTLKASQKDKFSLNSSIIGLNTSLPDWKILLDCENTVMEGSLCECLMCAF